MLSPLTVLLAGAICVHAAQLTLHHRVFHPSISDAPFAQRGTLDISGDNIHFDSVSTVSEDLARFAQKLNPETDISQAIYQVALQHPDHASQSEWAISSVKLCHLSESTTSQTLFLYISDADSPYAIDYFVSPVSHQGICPPQQKTDPEAPSFVAFSERITYLNTTILLRRPSTPPSPELKTPPPLTPEGQVVQPVPEKTFLQKYWMYISIFLVAIMLTGGGPEEGAK